MRLLNRKKPSTQISTVRVEVFRYDLTGNSVESKAFNEMVPSLVENRKSRKTTKVKAPSGDKKSLQGDKFEDCRDEREVKLARAEDEGFEVLPKSSSKKKSTRKDAMVIARAGKDTAARQTKTERMKSLFGRKKKLDVVATVHPDEASVVTQNNNGIVAERKSGHGQNTVSFLEKTEEIDVPVPPANDNDDGFSSDKNEQETIIEDDHLIEIAHAAQKLAQNIIEPVERDPSIDDVKKAISTIRQHAKRLGLEERELLEAVQNDKRSIESGYFNDDGTIITMETGNRTAPSTGNGTGTYSGHETDDTDGGTANTEHFTTETEYREHFPSLMKVLDIFDYYFLLV